MNTIIQSPVNPIHDSSNQQRTSAEVVKSPYFVNQSTINVNTVPQIRGRGKGRGQKGSIRRFKSYKL